MLKYLLTPYSPYSVSIPLTFLSLCEQTPNRIIDVPKASRRMALQNSRLMVIILMFFGFTNAAVDTGVIGVSSWQDECARRAVASNITGGFVDQFGNRMTSFNNETWGITKATCYDICGWNTIRQVRLHSPPSWVLPTDAMCTEY
jgi:hypothetical protein